MQIKRRTNVIDVLAPFVRNFHVMQQWRINFLSSRVPLDSTHVVNEAVSVEAILKSLMQMI